MTSLAEQARSLYAQRRFSDCERVCRAMLSENPDDVNALSTLGYLAMHGNELDIAIDCFKRASKLEPTDSGHLGVLATALRHAGRHTEALHAQQACVDLAPGDAGALTNLALQFAEAGRYDEATASYEMALSIRPDLGKAHYGLALIKKFQPDDARLPVLLDAFNAPQLGENDRTGIAFSLGRAFDDLGDFDRAFEYFSLANSIKKKSSHYDADAAHEHIRRLAKAFDAHLLTQNHDAGETSEIPVFIVGMPRSGSTLLEQILANHPAIEGGGELPWAAQVLDTLAPKHLDAGQNLPEAVAQLPRDAWKQMGAAYLEKIPALTDGALHYVDKQLLNYLLVGPIHLMLPNARFVHCLRDPMDTCVSCYTQNFGAGPGFSCDLNDLGRAYANHTEIMTHWRSWLPAGTLIEVQYEHLIENLEGTLRPLLEFLNLPWSDSCLGFADSSKPVTTSSLGQVRKGIYSSSVGRWRRFANHLDPLQAALQATPGGGE